MHACCLSEQACATWLDAAALRPPTALQDHKAVGDGDTGPNTGGMGSYSPAPVLTPAIEEQVGRDTLELDGTGQEATVAAAAAAALPGSPPSSIPLLLSSSSPS